MDGFAGGFAGGEPSAATDPTEPLAPSLDAEPRRPGRPQLADPDQIALHAVALFAERGFDTVTMHDIAEAAGLSRRTLFRHFETKADLVWRDVFDTSASLIELLGEPGTRPGIDGVRTHLRPMLDLDDQAHARVRVRLRIIGDYPDVFTVGIGRLGVMRAALVDHFGRHDVAGGEALVASVAADAVIATLLSASVWWARHSRDALGEVVDQALVRLRDGLN